MLDSLASAAMAMGHTKEQISEKILNHALEIIYLLTGEKYVIVKKKFPHCCIHPKSGGVPVRCEDIAVYFSMEEWNYVKGHKEDYEDVIMDTDVPSNTMEATEDTDLSLPSLHAEEGQCAQLFQSAQTNVKATSTADVSTNTSPEVPPDAPADNPDGETQEEEGDKDKEKTEDKSKGPSEDRGDMEDSDGDNSPASKKESSTSSPVTLRGTERKSSGTVPQYNGDPTKKDVVRPFAGPLYGEAVRFEMTEEIQEDGTVRPLSTEATLLDKLHPEIYRYDQNIWSISQRFICGTNNKPYNQPPIIEDDDEGDPDPSLLQLPNLPQKKMYRCVACEQLFKYKSSVTRHYTVAHGVKPYQCNECGKRFSTKFNSVVHKCHTRKNKSASSSSNSSSEPNS
ncbi:uncharacterized protein PAF06_002596 [Gastrophryne carolinensis]